MSETIKYITTFSFVGETINCYYLSMSKKYMSGMINIAANTLEEFFDRFADRALDKRKNKIYDRLEELEREYNSLEKKEIPLHAWLNLTEGEFKLWKEFKDLPLDMLYKETD